MDRRRLRGQPIFSGVRIEVGGRQESAASTIPVQDQRAQITQQWPELQEIGGVNSDGRTNDNG